MNKEEFVHYLHKKHRRPQHFYADALTEILEGIRHQLSQGKKVYFQELGTFYTRVHKGGKGRNLKTGESIEYGAVHQAAFRPGEVLKRAVRKKKEPPVKQKKGLLSRFKK